MNRLKSFRFALVTTLMVAIAAPSQAKKGDEARDCDDTDSGIMSMQGTLAVMSTSELSSCSTKTELQGGVLVEFQSAKKHPGKPKFCDITLSMVTVTLTDALGNTSSSGIVQGKLLVPDCSTGTCEGGTPMDVLGVVAPDGSIQLSIATKKGYDYYKSSAQELAASGTGTVLFNPREYSIKTKGYYVGHVSLLR